MRLLDTSPLPDLRARRSAKWQTYPADVLPLFVAEMDFTLAPPVVDAIAEAAQRSDVGYASGPGDVAVPFAGFAGRRWGWEVDPGRVRTTTDVSVGIVESLRRVVRPGDAVVVTSPVYPPFFDLVAEAGGRVVDVPVLEPGTDRAALDLHGIEAAFAAGARAMVLCHPHNPLGLVHPRDTLAEVARLAAAYDVLVVSDEIHAPLVHRGTVFTPFLDVSDEARAQGICVTSASKAWNVAGAKCALMVAATDERLALLDAMPEEVGFRTSLLGVRANGAAFAAGDDWLDDAVRTVEHNLSHLREELARLLPEVTFAAPHASYLAWLDMRALGWGDDPSAVILDKARVALVPGRTFGPAGAGYARLNVATSPEIITEAVERIAGISH